MVISVEMNRRENHMRERENMVIKIRINIGYRIIIIIKSLNIHCGEDEKTKKKMRTLSLCVYARENDNRMYIIIYGHWNRVCKAEEKTGNDRPKKRKLNLTKLIKHIYSANICFSLFNSDQCVRLN